MSNKWPLDFLLHLRLWEALGIQRCQSWSGCKFHVVQSSISKLIDCILTSGHFVEFSELNSIYLLYRAFWLHPSSLWFFSSIWTNLTGQDRRYLGVGHLPCIWLDPLSMWCIPCHSWLDWAGRSIITWTSHTSWAAPSFAEEVDFALWKWHLCNHPLTEWQNVHRCWARLRAWPSFFCWWWEPTHRSSILVHMFSLFSWWIYDRICDLDSCGYW